MRLRAARCFVARSKFRDAEPGSAGCREMASDGAHDDVLESIEQAMISEERKRAFLRRSIGKPEVRLPTGCPARRVTCDALDAMFRARRRNRRRRSCRRR
jgi:hypothetical protein